MTKYLLDSNVLIQAKNFHYQFSFCKAFWNLIIDLHNQGILFSIEKVRQEILSGDDELSDWVSALPATFWLKDHEASDTYSKVINWASEADFKTKALQDFSVYEAADAWLIAYAAKNGYSIISQEKSDPNQRKKIYLADAAVAFKIEYLTVFSFLALYSEPEFVPLIEAI